MKKLLILILTFSMLISMFACRGKNGGDAVSTTPEPEPPAPDDGTRVHSWISQSYDKNTGHDLVNDKGNVYDFKVNYGRPNYRPFSVLKRSHETGKTEKYTAVQTKCLYNHNSTIYGSSGDGLVRVDTIGDGSNLQNYNEYSSPGMFYILPNGGYDILICFTAPEDGVYNVRAAAQRTRLVYTQNGVNGTGSRFFIEHNGDVIVEETDHAVESTKAIAFDEQLTLKKGDTVCFGHDPLDGEIVGQAGMADDSVIKYFYLEQVGEEKETTKDTTHIELQMAKNELESFQISVNSPVALEGLNIKNVSKTVDGLSVEYLEEHNLSVFNMLFPDGLTDSNGTFNVKANETKTMLIRFNSSKEVKAGNYSFTFQLRSATGYILETFTVDLTVWNFSLPDESGCDTATGVYKEYIVQMEGIPEDKADEYYKLYYDKLLEYRMNCYDLPYDILDKRAEAYMSDPRVTSFRLDSTVDDATLKAYNDKLKSNPVWLEKAYFYPIDEPTNGDHLRRLAELCTRLRTHAPDVQIVVPFFVNIDAGGRDEIDFLSDYLDLWCPKSACWNPGFIADPYNKGYFGDRMEAMKDRGDKLWWYVCWEPCYPYCNLQINEIGIQHRTLFWQQYSYGVNGLLYWSSNYWNGVGNIWEDGNTVKWITPYVFGDGSLVYSGAQVGEKGACGSLRLECIRNGIEDFDMLRLAEKHLGKDWVDEQIDKVTKSLVNHTDNSELFASVRKAIGDELSKKF